MQSESCHAFMYWCPPSCCVKSSDVHATPRQTSCSQFGSSSGPVIPVFNLPTALLCNLLHQSRTVRDNKPSQAFDKLEHLTRADRNAVQTSDSPVKSRSPICTQ